MALFPSVIPWTLVLTQVMTAGLAVVPGRWAHLFRKCLQVQVLCGWEREQRTQRSRLPLPVGSGSLEEEEEKKNPFALFKKVEEESENLHRIRGHSIPSSDVPSRMHTLTYSAKICMGGWSRSFQILVMPYSQLNGYYTDGLEQAPRLTKKRRHIIQTWLHYSVENAFSFKRQYLEYFFTFDCYELRRRPHMAFQSQGKWYLYV